MIKINDELVTKITIEAQKSNRKRKNYNFHKQSSDLLQRMLNAIEPGSYVQPHKHESPDKREVFVLLKGIALIIQYNNSGEITDHFILSEKSENYAVEIPPRVYHTIISLKSGTVVYEIKDGPYDEKDDKNFADWAPKENTPECDAYLNSMLEKLNLKLNDHIVN